MTTATDRLSPAQAPPHGVALRADELGFDDLILVQVSLAAWRVYTTEFTRENPRRLIGCIDRRGDLFELMELGDGFRWHTFASLHETLEHAALRAHDLAARRQLGELSWLH